MTMFAFLTLLMPLMGFVVSPFSKRFSGIIATSFVGASLFFSILTLVTFSEPSKATLMTWLSHEPLKVDFAIYIDELTLLMMIVVTTVSFLVHFYSVGYMDKDPSKRRFFPYLNLFVFSMLLLVMASNYLVFFIGWELVGLCSYLLIGFWYERPQARYAARKAIVVTRLLDLGLILGIFLIFIWSGTLDYTEFWEKIPGIPEFILSCIAILLFLGAMGKSAQIPFHIWLPDAMEGPTPVSALIHAATMVTAGVFLVARNSQLFNSIPEINQLILIIGGITTLISGIIALTVNDLKRILAYSTISHLGLMFVGVALFEKQLGIFHLYTHAFFKALLFLVAGCIMHVSHGEMDIRKLRGILKSYPTLTFSFLIGALSLAGFPPLSGFFSKELIIHHAHENQLVYFLLVLSTFVTSLYIFRAFFFLTLGKSNHKGEKIGMEYHIPLLLLSLLTIFSHIFPKNHLNYFRHLPPLSLGYETILLTVLPLLGLIFSHLFISKKLVIKAPKVIYSLVQGKFFFDEIYYYLLLKPFYLTVSLTKKLLDEWTIDGIIHLIRDFSLSLGSLLRLFARENVKIYLLWIFLGFNLILLVLIR